MIQLTRINKVEVFWLNEDKIEFMEETPDTIISLESGKKIPVAESAEQVLKLITERKREYFSKLF